MWIHVAYKESLLDMGLRQKAKNSFKSLKITTFGET